ncbi:hypothetical protein EJ08DRAFT_150704 [Tothia fuscella]|uniref:Uncharacterized protein n=1 Tax=Tothia fuscella TaxID=1048955 RepID=A0A9P4U4Z2_9PEZI|nr:hypothetical protein EJ08DRAFT_150704 [Tothia fuscella]
MVFRRSRWYCWLALRLWSLSRRFEAYANSDGCFLHVPPGRRKFAYIALLCALYTCAEIAQYQYLGDSGAWLGNITAGTPLKTILPKDGGYGAVDMFYAPAHGTFIFTYTNNASDSTIYYQYLKPDHALLPYYIPSKGDLDLVENILKYNWSEPQVLYKANDIPEGESVQLAGPHLGYYEKDDITNGGTRMLITWTVSTGQDGGSRASGYELRSASIQWNSGADGVFVMNAVTYYGLVVCVGLFLW